MSICILYLCPCIRDNVYIALVKYFLERGKKLTYAKHHGPMVDYNIHFIIIRVQYKV